MRLESIEPIAIEIPLKKNFGGATYSVLKRCTVVTRLTTSDGLASEVYNGDNREHGAEIVRLVRDEIFPAIKGMNVFEVERIWEKMFALSHMSRDRKLLMEAIACVDCAVWDIVGKAQGKSVRELLGGYRDRLQIISIGGYYMKGKTLADIGHEMELYRTEGMAGCKFKVGGRSPAEDATRVETARRASGDDFVLMVDANRGWNAQDAIDFARRIEHLNIRWFEEPCHWYDDAAMMARVRRSIRMPVAAGQSEITSHAIRRLIDAGAVDFVNYDVSEGGGVTDWRRAAGMCAASGASRWRTTRNRRSRSTCFQRCLTARMPNASATRARPGVADDVGQPAEDRGRLVHRFAGCGFRHHARSGDGQALPRELKPFILRLRRLRAYAQDERRGSDPGFRFCLVGV